VINPEPEWLTAAQQGDTDAFCQLVTIYQKPVYNLCYRMLGDPDEADDAAQETFLRAYSGLQRYDCERSFSTWLLSIAAHYCIDRLRRRRYLTFSFDQMPYLDPPDPAPSPEASAAASETRRRVANLLNHLSPPDRAAIIMLYWYDFSYEEIAQALDLSVSALKSRLHRARRDLAELWLDQTTLPLTPERSLHGEIRSPAF